MKLGLDLQGGLYIILELDYYAYLLQQSNVTQTALSKQDLSQLINKAINVSNQNQTDVLDQFKTIAAENEIKLISYYSNLLRSNPGMTDQDIIKILITNRECFFILFLL